MSLRVTLKRLKALAMLAVNRKRFYFAQRVTGFTVGDEPHFHPDSKPFFESLLRGSRSYLEYGVGGSTILAARLGKPFVSVDTDGHYLRAVAKRVGSLRSDQRLIHAYIGLTREWGFPVFAGCPTAREVANWRVYPEIPWKQVRPDNRPDLVLVDGRFRVAAALTSIKYMCADPDARILVDDYTYRPEYEVIERFAVLCETVGHMAVFKPSGEPHEGLGRTIEQYSTDCR